MALKDWKKIGEMAWKKHLKTLTITGYGYEYPINYLVKVFNDTGWTNKNIEVSKPFETKSQAMRYARQYMRTH